MKRTRILKALAVTAALPLLYLADGAPDALPGMSLIREALANNRDLRRAAARVEVAAAQARILGADRRPHHEAQRRTTPRHLHGARLDRVLEQPQRLRLERRANAHQR